MTEMYSLSSLIAFVYCIYLEEATATFIIHRVFYLLKHRVHDLYSLTGGLGQVKFMPSSSLLIT
jgi:hypothetical protein